MEQGADVPVTVRDDQEAAILLVLREVFKRCRGNAVRIQEILKEEYQIDIAYSTLTRCIKNAELRAPIKRAGEYCFEPGVEMQHDTSPHWVMLGEKKIQAQCASLVLGYSRKLFVQYYERFTRFEAKAFLKLAFEFMQGLCQRCVIDNTSVILAGGSGPNAVISPEMMAYCRMYGFEFIAHRIMHSDRKGKVERPFHYVENNFLAGRTFKDWNDLNHQARQWCIDVGKKEKRSLGMTPDAAFIEEKPHLIRLPVVPPAIYEHYQRMVDTKAFINLDTNRYSVPEKLIGKTLDVYKYLEEIRIFYQHQEIAIHPRLAGKKFNVSKIPGHHLKSHVRQTNEAFQGRENLLREYDEALGLYISTLKKHVRGSGHRQLNHLLNLKRTYPKEPFIRAIKQAHHYGLYDLSRLEDLIIKFVSGEYFNLDEEQS